ncbi:MAG TPA: trypsin-like peptidase domain-containing protein, partial [Candidatus Binatia bacterium]|nr:trypsin-like peptidase domain-containing protein [Candidatus Binatia bacterium]
MAKTCTTIVILLLLVGGARAGAPETEPMRRSRVVEAVERARPAVVNISTEQVVIQRPSPVDPFFDEFFRDFFDSRPRRSTRRSLGSGVIVRGDGTILTNEHVILRGGRIHVTLADGGEYEAKLVGRDPDADLAVLRIDAGRVPYIALGSSSDLMIGETVIAIGNPFGLSHTVTTGVVSATKRTLQTGGRTFTDFIQTDASINPGNSGGPLVDLQGRIVGINTAIVAPSGGNVGIGFAVPINMARQVTDQLTRYGEIKRGRIGVAIQDLTPDIAQALGTKYTQGAVIARVEPGSAAERAGLRTNDLVVAVNGVP